MESPAKILMTEHVTHDVKRFIVEKPSGYGFTPGQATEVSVDLPAWKKEKRPFTFTSLAEDLVLEFTIKGYYDHKGVTQKLHSLIPGDRIILRDVWGTINYKGPGIFIAGGAGITPFIAILRMLRAQNKIKGNRLFFSNKTWRDIIIERELRDMFPPEDLMLTLTQEKREGYSYGRIDGNFLKEYIADFTGSFYVCGPKKMVSEIREVLEKHGAKPDSIVFEK